MAARDKVVVMTPEEAEVARKAADVAELEKQFANHKNEHTTEEVLAMVNAKDLQDNDRMALRHRLALEHRKDPTDPPECPGFFITVNGNLRRDW
jgi:hypothetical protein